MRKLRYFFKGKLFVTLLAVAAVAAATAIALVYLPARLRFLYPAGRAAAMLAGVWIACGRLSPDRKTAWLVFLLLFPRTALLFLLIQRPAPVKEGAPCALSANTADYFSTGKEFRQMLERDVRSAKKSVFLDYYILAKGQFWDSVYALLKQKAKEGVDVRVVYDDFGCCLGLPRNFFKQMRADGIACRVYRPLRLSPKSTRRDHRKLTVIDGAIAYTGGINLSDEYIGGVIRFGHWKDVAIRVTGSAARAAHLAFLSEWEKSPKRTPIKPSNAGMPCSFALDTASGEREGVALTKSLFRAARQRLYLFTPYLAPDGALIELMRQAVAAGADVRVIMPHIPDKRSVFLISRHYARILNGFGVRVREYDAGFLHAKVTLSDQTAFVSSYNLDSRSMYLQAECGFAVTDEELSARVAQDFLNLWQLSSPPKRAGRAERAIGAFFALFAPLI